LTICLPNSYQDLYDTDKQYNANSFALRKILANMPGSGHLYGLLFNPAYFKVFKELKILARLRAGGQYAGNYYRGG
jgi:hypothetical protein